jgi:GNAT superfamily N-acetyltransferase
MKMELIKFREANLSDGDKIVEMYIESDSPGWWNQRNTFNLHWKILQLSDGKTFIATYKEKVVAHAELLLVNEEPNAWHTAFLSNLEVHKDFRRKGIGTSLLKYLTQYTKTLGYFSLETIPQDNISEKLYIKQGFNCKTVLYELAISPKVMGRNRYREATKKEENIEVEKFWFLLGRQYPAKYTWWKSKVGGKYQMFGYQSPIVCCLKNGVILIDGIFIYLFILPTLSQNTRSIKRLIEVSSMVMKKYNKSEILTLCEKRIIPLVELFYEIKEQTKVKVMRKWV